MIICLDWIEGKNYSGTLILRWRRGGLAAPGGGDSLLLLVAIHPVDNKLIEADIFGPNVYWTVCLWAY